MSGMMATRPPITTSGNSSALPLFWARCDHRPRPTVSGYSRFSQAGTRGSGRGGRATAAAAGRQQGGEGWGQTWTNSMPDSWQNTFQSAA